MNRKLNLIFITIVFLALLALFILPNVISKEKVEAESIKVEVLNEDEEVQNEEEDYPNSVEDLDETYYSKFMGQGRKVLVYNWGEYISDGSDDMMAVNKAFTQATGIEVVYLTFSTNEELYAKLKSGNSNYDVIIPSDYMIARMIEENMLKPLDFSKLPNFEYIDEQFKNPTYDSDSLYSIPYTWGLTGIIYNKNLVSEDDNVNSWEILWNEKYLGEILMFANSRDAFSIAQKLLGYSLNTTDPDELKKSLELLKQQKPLVQAYVMDEIFDKMLIGEAALAPYYAGDALTMIEDNPDLAFSLPNEGVNIFVDAMSVPSGSKNYEEAMMYINFMMEPVVALNNSIYIGYATPNAGAKEYMSEEMLNNPIIYPAADVIEKAEYFISLPREGNLLMDEYWTELLSDDQNYNRMFMPVLLGLAIIAIIAVNIYRSNSRRRKQKYY